MSWVAAAAFYNSTLRRFISVKQLKIFFIGRVSNVKGNLAKKQFIQSAALIDLLPVLFSNQGYINYWLRINALWNLQ